MDKLNMKSKDITKDNIEKIEKLFPNVITEIKGNGGSITKAIDFELLKQELMDEIVEGDKERYQLTWPGKKEAILLGNTPINKTLRPAKEESVDWENTENLYIEGDNLEVLKLLQESYLNKVKCIYIDPPYNTGKDFVYKDNFTQDKDEYLEESGQADEEGNRLFLNTDANGRYHSDWLTMMYPRLKLARNLLSEDGVIFISIDDNEVHNLRKMCDEVFGERNFVAALPTIMNLKGNNDQFGFAGTHEYTLVYSKSYSYCLLNEFMLDEEEADDWLVDEYGVYKKGANLKATGVNAPREKRPNLYFPIYIEDFSANGVSEKDGEELRWSLEKIDENYIELYPITNGQEMSWRWSKAKFINEKHNVIVNSDGKGRIAIYKKQRPSIGDIPSKKPKSLFYKPEYSSGNGTTEIKELFDNKTFNNPKPLSLIIDMCQIGSSQDSIILDFFSGSATTAHAVMQLNAEDSGNRKYIMVQLPEETDEKSEAYKAGYKTIAEIGKERIRRAAKKIKEETNLSLDYGFRVFKVDSSNMKDVYYLPNELTQMNLHDLTENIKEDRTGLDLLSQVILESGLELSLPMETKIINGKEVYFVDEDALIACFDKNIDEILIREIAKEKPLKAIFRDNSFKDCPSRINLEEIFKSLSPNTEIKVL